MIFRSLKHSSDNVPSVIYNFVTVSCLLCLFRARLRVGCVRMGAGVCGCFLVAPQSARVCVFLTALSVSPCMRLCISVCSTVCVCVCVFQSGHDVTVKSV